MKYKLSLALLALSLLAGGFTQTTDTTFDSNGVKIHYVTEGEGEPVVLIHGWMSDSTMWGRDKAGNTKLSPLEGFKLIAMDCRGHGKSDKPHEVEKYGEEMAEDVVRLLDHLKIKRAHLIGYSMGAFIAGKVAATHSERVISIVYGGQVPLVIGAPPSGSREVEVFAKAVAEGKGLGPYLLEVMREPKPTPENADALAKFLYGSKDVVAFSAAGRSFDQLQVPLESLRKCKAPVLYIYGSGESDHLKARVASLQKELGQGELKVVEGSDHITALIKPEFGTSIIAFLRAHKTGPRVS